MFTLSDLEDARAIVHSVIAPTPQYAWPMLCGNSGTEVWVKHENHTPTGSFKVRGGLVLLEELRRRNELSNGLITATRGNHGQSIPYAASRFSVPVTVLVPRGNSVEKNRAMQAWGAELIEYGADFDDAREEAARIARERDLRLVPAFHVSLVKGVATYAHELFTAVPDLNTVYVPIGMGSGICGLITTRDLLGLDTEIVGVVSSRAPAFRLSWDAKRIVQTSSANTFADGMACRVPTQEPLDIIRAGASRIVEVTDDEVADAMRVLFTDTHNVAEGAGAAAFAAYRQEAPKNRKVGVILSGGNVDSEVFRAVLGGATPTP
ncbi:MAG: threonine dehydratase [Gammaproteobacteria bacterium]|nr:threonine dehydratase [Gammaproteobacteria bacterium]